MTDPRYPIRAVSKLTGLSVDTLRAWERRYAAVAPERDDRGRLYSREQVERLGLLRQVVERGHAIGRVASLPAAELRTLLARDGRRGAAAAPAPTAAVDLAPLEDAIERFDGAALRSELSRLAAVLPARAFARDVALPLLHLAGERWREGRLSIAQEHLVTAELRSLIGALARLHPLPDGALPVVLATPEGEQHELGTLAAALLAAGAGLAAIYLGPSLPAAEIASVARRVGARLVVLGFNGAATAPRGAEEIAALARDLPRDVELWVGGAGAEEAAAAAKGRVAALPDFDAYERELARLGA